MQSDVFERAKELDTEIRDLQYSIAAIEHGELSIAVFGLSTPIPERLQREWRGMLLHDMKTRLDKVGTEFAAL